MCIKIPAFNESFFVKNQENSSSCVTLISQVSKDSFDLYCQMFDKLGFSKKEEYDTIGHNFAAYLKDDIGFFLNFFENARELYIVEETNCRYFSFVDKAMETKHTQQITQICLEDFGMSYVVRLGDGRFIVFDGGREFEPDCDRLYKCLKDGSMSDKPVISAWIMTHAHADHYHCFLRFIDKYADDVIIEKFMYNFPEHDDFEHYPALKNKDGRFEEDSSPYVNIPKMKEKIAKTGAAVYTPHTGQIFNIGDSKCEILSSMDDTIHCSNDINASSLVIRMELAGQVILWTADTGVVCAKLAQKYKEHLKADIMQIPHHGFQWGDTETEIECFEYIKPSVCFLPVSDYNAYRNVCTYRPSTNYIMSKLGIDELITGDVQRTLNLPYKAPEYARRELKEKYQKGRESCGANTWIFTGLNTSNEEDLKFTILNTTISVANVSIDIYFEDPAKNIRYIKTQIPQWCIRTIYIADSEDVDGDAVYFNWRSLKTLGIPEDSEFAIRFISDIPVVVSHKNHRESYHM